MVIIDLKKCNLILNNALESTTSIKEAKRNIVHNFAQFASSSSLDTIFLILLVALGNLSDSKEIKNLSLFSCMLLGTNFLIFITIYPAFLSLILQFKKNVQQSNDEKIIRQKNDKNDSTNLIFNAITNPVLVYVKILMTLFLIIIHLKLNYFSQKSSTSNITDNLLKNESNYTHSSKQNDKVIFYTESCLLITLNVYMLGRIFNNYNKKSIETNRQEKRVKFSLSSNADLIDNNKDNNNNNNDSCSNLIKLNEPKKVETKNVMIQTDSVVIKNEEVSETFESRVVLEKRPSEECLKILRERLTQKIDDFLDEEVIDLVKKKNIPIYKLETYFHNPERGVNLRRKIVEEKLAKNCIQTIPYKDYNYSKVIGSCCENIIGYVPVPLGVAGPLLIDDVYYHIPMATTEGTLVASTNRGCTALSSSHGVFTKVMSDGMTRGPVIKLNSAMRAAEVKEWLEEEENFAIIKRAFDSTSRFAKLESCKCCVVGRYLYIRFRSSTGDAMGMNMLSKVIK